MGSLKPRRASCMNLQLSVPILKNSELTHKVCLRNCGTIIQKMIYLKFKKNCVMAVLLGLTLF